MACIINIDEVTLLAITNAAGDIVRIDVEGDTEGCRELGVSLHDDSTGIVIGRLLIEDLNPNQITHWTATFDEGQGSTLRGVSCGDKVSVRAVCTDGACRDEKLSLLLPCEPVDGGGCPDVVVTVRPGDCNQPKTERTMIFEVAVGGDGQIEYRWNFGDGSAQTLPATGSGTFEQPHSYVAVADDTYFANLIIVGPAGCTATPDPITVEVDACAKAVCPSATLSVSVSPNCNKDGTRTATFGIGLSNLPAGSPVFGTLHLGDGVPGSGTIPVQFDPAAPGPEWTAQASGFVGQFTFDYQPGTYNNVSFEITFPTDCQDTVPLNDQDTVPLNSGRLDIGVCTVTNCPTALTIEVRDSNNQPFPTGPNDPCLPAGDYVITVTQPNPIGRTYTWSVDTQDGNGSQVDNGPNVNGLNRSTYSRTIAAGSTTLISVVVETPNCDTPVPGSVELRACGNVPPPPPPPPLLPDETAIDWCHIWFWINVGLMVVTGGFILATFCLIQANVWSAVLTFLSGGAWGPVWAALTVVNVWMLIISVVLVLITLGSFVAWIFICALGHLGTNACQLLGILITILTVLDAVAGILAIIFALIGMTVCAVGSFIDVAWFGVLLIITWWVSLALGCSLRDSRLVVERKRR